VDNVDRSDDDSFDRTHSLHGKSADRIYMRLPMTAI
jgi:hypothetical protein